MARARRAATVHAEDLRGGAALLLAALAAEGESRVQEAAHLDRGYERLLGKLRELGALVRREGVDDTQSEGPQALRGISDGAGFAVEAKKERAPVTM